jgi:hypothetical protein
MAKKKPAKRNYKKGELVKTRTASGKVAFVPPGTSADKLPQTLYPYSKPVADFICQKYMEGLTMSKIAKLDGVPPQHIIYSWKRHHPEFRKDLKLAKEDRAEYFHDEILDEARSIKKKSEAVVAKVKIDALKWAAGVNNPKEYSGKAEEKEATGALQIIIDTGIRRKEDIKEVINVQVDSDKGEGREALPADLRKDRLDGED